MKLLWTGSDVLFATRPIGGKKFPTKKSKWIYFIGCMIFAKIADLFVEYHYVVSNHLIEELKPLKFKKNIKILIDPPKSFPNIKKKPHDGFNVLYYRCLGTNMPFKNWVYGYDIISKVKWHFKTNPDIHFIEVNGNSDMNEIYAITNVYCRCCRHDGAPRMIMECEQLGIPYYWSKENPDFLDIINFIEKEYKNV